MTEHKYTDDEIIRALECHKSTSLVDCESCPLHSKKVGFEKCHIELFNCVYDLIKRYKAEIWALKETLVGRLSASAAFAIKESEAKGKAMVHSLKAEAIKEFAERLKSKQRRILDYDEAGFSAPIHIVETEIIDNLVKEMTEGER